MKINSTVGFIAVDTRTDTPLMHTLASDIAGCHFNQKVGELCDPKIKVLPVHIDITPLTAAEQLAIEEGRYDRQQQPALGIGASFDETATIGIP